MSGGNSWSSSEMWSMESNHIDYLSTDEVAQIYHKPIELGILTVGRWLSCPLVKILVQSLKVLGYIVGGVVDARKGKQQT